MRRVCPDEGPCPLCAPLPRSTWSFHHDDLPAPFRFLELSPAGQEAATEDQERRLLRCPRCGTHYEHLILFDDDDFIPRDEHTLTRLAPTEVLQRLDGTALHIWQRGYPWLIAKVQRELHHPSRARRREAAWALALHHLEHDDGVGALSETLLASVDPVLHQQALAPLAVRAEAGLDVSGLEARLSVLVASPERSIRRLAARVWAWHVAHHLPQEALEELLGAHASAPLRESALDVLRCWAVEGDDLARWWPHVVRALSDPDEAVCDAAGWVLSAVFRSASPSCAELMQTLVPVLGSGSDSARVAATRALFAAAEAGCDVSMVEGALIALLRVPTTSALAMAVLRVAVNRGASLDRALLPIREAVVGGTLRAPADVCWVAMTAIQRGDEVQPLVAALAHIASTQPQGREGAVSQLRLAAERGHDLGSALASLQRVSVVADTPFVRSQALAALAWHHARKAQWDALEELGTQGPREARAAVIPALEDAVRHGVGGDRARPLLAAWRRGL